MSNTFLSFRHHLVVALLLCIAPTLGLCQFTNPNLLSMVKAEQAFIKMAADHNTRDAFLHFLSDEAVTVGEYGPVVGKSALKKQRPNESLLSWRVEYCDIASSGDFGYNVGPWSYKASRKDTTIAAFGQFHSIWVKQHDGLWKNVLDIGIGYESAMPKDSLRTSAIALKPPAVKTPAVQAIVSLMSHEKEFIDAYKKNGLAAYAAVASAEIRFSRQGERPIVSSKDKEAFLKGRRNTFFNPVLIDGGIASSGDMGYVYGTADAVVYADNKQEKKIATYLRVWKKEDGISWKIVLDVMTYQ